MFTEEELDRVRSTMGLRQEPIRTLRRKLREHGYSELNVSKRICAAIERELESRP